MSPREVRQAKDAAILKAIDEATRCNGQHSTVERLLDCPDCAAALRAVME